MHYVNVAERAERQVAIDWSNAVQSNWYVNKLREIVRGARNNDREWHEEVYGTFDAPLKTLHVFTFHDWRWFTISQEAQHSKDNWYFL